MANVIYKGGFLYSVWSGQLKVYEGDVYDAEYQTKQGRFYAPSIKKGFQCGLQAGEVFNAVVWLAEENKELALQMLISNEELSMAILQEKMDNHINKIRILKGVNH
jgi:hypothetical protein